MASIKRGDQVKTIIEIENGAWTPNVKQGATGTVIEVKSGGSIANVHFASAGFFWPEVTCDVETRYLDKK